MYLIIGSSGQLGSRVTRRLLDAGQTVRAHSRDPDQKLQALVDAGAEPIKGDLKTDEWIDDAMRGVTRLLMASQTLFPPSRTNHAGIVDEPGNRRVINAARRAGVEQIVFMSATMAEPSFPVQFIQAKHTTEEYLKSSGIAHTIIRPTYFTEVHGLSMLGKPLVDNGTVQFFGTGTTPLRWISVEDVADYVVKAFVDPADQNAIRVIGGADVMSRLQMLETLEKHAEKQAKRKHVPLTMMRVMRGPAKLVNPGLSDLISFAIAEETMPDHPGFAPPMLDWEGPTTVDNVVNRWVGTVHSRPS